MDSIIMFISTIFYSILNINLLIDFYGRKGPKPRWAWTTLCWQLSWFNSRPFHRELVKRISHWISQLQPHQRKQSPSYHVITTVRPGVPPHLLLLFLVQVCVSVYGFRRSYTCQCVCRVSSWHPVYTSTFSVTSMMCVWGIMFCGNFRALVTLSR